MVARHSDGKDENTGFWTIGFGNSPVIGTAIHDGHRIRPDIAGLMALSGEQRLREEDPFTGDMIAGLTNRVIVHHSRFEIDLNRAADQAIYLKPEQSWGLEVWKQEPAPAAVRQSLDFHADYYAMLENTLAALERRHGAFVVLDVHTYNHRRQGPAAPPTTPAEAPDINIAPFPWTAAAGTISSAPSVIISRQRPLPDAVLMSARTWRFRARGNRPVSFTSVSRKTAVPSPSSSRNSLWTNGQESRTGA